MITQNAFNESIQQMLNQNLAMDSVIVKQGTNIFKHVFENGTQRKNIRSISKPIVSLCVGIAIEEGYFPNGIEEYIYPFIEDRCIKEETNKAYLKKLKIKHLITLTLGHEVRSMNSSQMAELKGKDLIDFVLNFPILHEPGSYFLYTNTPAYFMSYILQKVTGKKLLEYAKEKLFNPLGITDVNWKESEQGINMGCTGIDILNDDLLKIGELLLNDGIFEGKRIVDAKWIKAMKTPQVETPSMYDAKRVLPKFAYGYNLWICKNGTFYCDGTDGQYLIVLPHKDLIIVTMGYQSNMKPITECLRNLIDEN